MQNIIFSSISKLTFRPLITFFICNISVYQFPTAYAIRRLRGNIRLRMRVAVHTYNMLYQSYNTDEFIRRTPRQHLATVRKKKLRTYMILLINKQQQ
jgi:hypothetical protein